MAFDKKQFGEVLQRVPILEEEKTDPNVFIAEAESGGGGSVILWETYVSFRTLDYLPLRYAYRVLKAIDEQFPEHKIVIRVFTKRA